jgi:PAS domain S-box-containing protein
MGCIAVESDSTTTLLDAGSHADYDGFARLAALLCGTEHAAIEIAGTPAGGGNPEGRPAVARCPLCATTGERIGTITVYGRANQEITAAQHTALELLARQVTETIDLRSRAADELSRALIESAPVAIYHSLSNVAYYNPEYRRMFGLSDDPGPDDWAAGVHDEDRERIQALWNEFCRNPCATKFEYRMRPVDGVVRYLCEQLVPARGVAGFVGTISDFTDLVTARDNLQKAETLFADTFDQAPIGIAYADRHGRIQRCNRAYSALTGCTPEEPGERSDDGLELQRLWNGEIAVAEAERRHRRPDGTLVWVRSTTSLVRGLDGAPDCSVEFLRDITERKQYDLDLERVHKELMAASRQAGMAEVATNVLHNVGNILNSVNISASLVAERVKQSKASGVLRTADLLREQGSNLAQFLGDDARGRRIPEYLASLGEQLANDQRLTLEEIVSLRSNLEHIKDTVAMQQNYAKLCGVTEIVTVAELVEDSLRLNAGAFARHGVKVRREFTEVPQITVDKHKVLQILVNLIRNAKYACDESGRRDKEVILRIEPCAAGVRIAVVDNGIGIPAETMARLFSHGFTTRRSGHGFGLHSCALAAQELGATLRATSDGAGLGAAFILELPCEWQAAGA